ncbi:MAG: HAMP domain-containing sensor histidine kinase [Campylobacterota bacterium]
MSVIGSSFFTSGWTFDDSEKELKSRFQMTNIALVTSTFAFLFGIAVNYVKNIPDLLLMELFLVLSNIILFSLLRKYKKSLELVVLTITAQCTFLLLYILYTTDLESMKYLWLFTYPIVLLYFQKDRKGLYWSIFLVLILFIAPYQNILAVQHSPFQTTYISVVLSVVIVIVYFYQKKMNEAKDLIFDQQILLKEQIKELIHKDQLLSAQSRQAVMGEMISMIAHQWRQPLSTVTLSVSNLQVRKLLGDKIDDGALDKALEDISDTVVYLSNTIDDFQTYFHPNKELLEVEIHELIAKAVNFVLPRIKGTKIFIEIDNPNDKEIYFQTYTNELIQVFLNIINNAIDALIISNAQTPRIIISVEEKKDTLVIIIKDNADGIDAEEIHKIFEPYFSTKGKNGTGLGLYMSQMLVQKQFNGHIDVISTSKGSFFSVEIDKVLT